MEILLDSHAPIGDHHLISRVIDVVYVDASRGRALGGQGSILAHDGYGNLCVLVRACRGHLLVTRDLIHLLDYEVLLFYVVVVVGPLGETTAAWTPRKAVPAALRGCPLEFFVHRHYLGMLLLHTKPVTQLRKVLTHWIRYS